MKQIYPTLRSLLCMLGFLIVVLPQSKAQSGTDFWFAPPYVTHLHNPPGGVPIYLLLSSMGASSTVTVAQPANISFTPIVVTIAAGKSSRIDLSAFQAMLETSPTDSVLNTGLRITATTPITANYEEDNTNNPEDFALKGANALGTQFYIPITAFAPYYNNPFVGPNQPGEAIASFDIIATQNNTTVIIYSPVQVDGHPALQQFSIVLNAGQTYSCGWSGINYTDPSTHPAGAAVLADKPIAITVKDDSDHNASGGCYDLIGDQIIPVNILGTDYVAVKGFLNNGGNESVFITATENNTSIYLDGSMTAIRTMFAGETFRIDMDSITTAADNSLYVRASNPVYATHVTGFGCEMGSAILPPLNCAGSHQVNFMRSTNEAFYVTLLVHTTAINNFTITGPGTAAINPSSFTTVPGTSGQWMAARIQYTTTDVPVDSGFSVTNSADVFALGLINGGGTSGCRYGYFSEFVAPIVVNANVDQTVCANDTAQLNGSISGGATTGKWSSSGTGTFLPNTTTLNAKYIPSPSDIAESSVTLTLASTSICFPQQDQMVLTFTPAPVVNANIDQTVCKNNPGITLNGSVSIAGGGLWSGGAGVFTPDNTALSAIYMPTIAEINSGTLLLILTSTGNGTCHAVSDNMVVTFSPSPTADAGTDQMLCGNNPDVTLNGSITTATGGLWSGGAGSFSPSSTALNAVYSPTSAEITSGNITLTLTTTGNANCDAVSDQMTVNFTLPPTVNAGPDQTLCTNNPLATLNGSVSVASGGVWSGGLGTFFPDNTSLNATYNPTAAELTTGSVRLTLTSSGNGKCSSVSDQMIISFTPAPIVHAGSDQIVCKNNPAVTLNGSVTISTGGIWSGGTGTFSPDNTTLNAIYTPSTAELIAGTVTLTLTSTGNGSCTAVSDDMLLTISPSPTVNAGTDQIVCGNNSDVTLNGLITVASGGIWSGGAGSYFPSNTSLNAVYTPTPSEIASGTVTLTLTSTGNGTCNAVSDQVTINFTLPPTVHAGSDRTICSNNATVILNGSVTVATGAQWTGGLGVFVPDNTTLNASYTPSAGEIASGSVTLTLVSTGNGNCIPASDQMILFFTPGPTVYAGGNQTVCVNNPSVVLNGNFSIATGIEWSGGTGTYNPDNTTVNAIYTPSDAEKIAGTVLLTLTTTGNGTCLPVTDNMTISIVSSPIVNAGTDILACMNRPEVSLSGNVSNASGGIWTGGSGTFSPNATTLTATYTPTSAEIASGNFALTLTSTGNGSCNAVSDQLLITFAPSPIVNAGPDQAVCANNASVNLNGSVSNASGGSWSGGSGLFSPGNSAFNAIYTPTQTEINSGNLKLVLTSSGNASCNAVSDTIMLFFSPAPTADAGTNLVSCSNNPSITLNGSYTVASGAVWSNGQGTFSPSETNMSAIYTPTAAEIAYGSVTLKLTTRGNGNCAVVTDSTTLTIISQPTVNAGNDQTICVSNLHVQLSGGIAGITNSGKWTSSGTGTFFPDNSVLNATYICSKQDSTNGFVKLALTSVNNGSCLAVSDTMQIIILPAGGAIAGNDVNVCANNAIVTLGGKITGGASSGTWSSTGTGVFSPDNTTLNAHYIPSPGDTASGTVTLTLTANSCNPASDQLVVTITTAPAVNAGMDQTVCSTNKNIQLNGSVKGSASTVVWSSTGTGTFVPNNTNLNAIYQASSSDSAERIIYLVLTSTNNGSCVAAKDTMRVNIYPSTTVNAGLDQTVCANNSSVVLNGSVSGGGPGIWSTSGSGVFTPDATALNATYTPSSADITNGFVNLVLTATNSCNTAIDFMNITINPSPIVDAGADQSICGSSPAIILAGSITNATGGIWSGGSGSFNPNNGSLNALYTPTSAEITSGTLTLVLSSIGNGICDPVSDNVIIHFTSAVSANAGIDQHVCKTSANANLQGIISNGSSTGKWSTLGSGIFIPNDSALNALYQFGSSDTAAGSVMLILSSTNNGSCATAKDSMKIVFGPSAFAYAGPDQVICSTGNLVNLNGLVSGGASTGNWSTTGGGLFSPGAQSLNATYTLSAGDFIAGGVQLILTTTNNGSCLAGTDTLTIVTKNPATVFAGMDQTACRSSSSVLLNGSINGETTSGQWHTLGSGTFVPDAQTLHASYLFSSGDYTAGTVQLVLTSTNNGSCGAVTDTVEIRIQQLSTVTAGSDQTLCSSNPILALNGVVSGGSTSGNWTSTGSGSFSPDAQTLNATYQPSTTDLVAGSVKLILTSTNTGQCPSVTDTLVIRYTNSPLVNAGTDQLFCNDGITIPLNGSVSTGTGIWKSLGSGVFNPDAATLGASYSPSQTDKTAGSVLLVLSSTNTGSCPGTSDTMKITFGTKPIAAFVETVSGETTTFSDQSRAATTWLWNFGDAGGRSTQENPVYSYSSSGTYTVTLIVSSTQGCMDTATADVTVDGTTVVVHPVAIPSGFTPNGDGINDVVPILGGPFLEVELKIYNQWGNQVFGTNDPNVSWDGKIAGILQPPGVYIYTAKGKTMDGKVFSFSGDVTLIR